jgi:hypothetical protein
MRKITRIRAKHAGSTRVRAKTGGGRGRAVSIMDTERIVPLGLRCGATFRLRQPADPDRSEGLGLTAVEEAMAAQFEHGEENGGLIAPRPASLEVRFRGERGIVRQGVADPAHGVAHAEILFRDGQ